MFVTTANSLANIPSPLLDRMEVIEFPGYIEEEKIEIANRYLIPRQLEENGIENLGVVVEPTALQRIIREYTYGAGVAPSFAWTETGGEIMPVEVAILEGKGGLQMTGQMGEVMQESGQAALTYIKSRASGLGIDLYVFERMDIHVHMPEGGIPKDGPSAGITMATAIVSALTGRPSQSQ